ncbi:MAG: 50S ribosome-binding GTPase, partial [Muribaculaceae bacterium]|nr:50S ribosome-binding GTPase [Muribaculaceae bacterium]
MNRQAVLKQIAQDLGATHEIDGILPLTLPADDPSFRLGVMGQPNAGKTSVIAALTGLKLGISPLPASDDFTLINEKGTQMPAGSPKGVIPADCPGLEGADMKIIEIHAPLSENSTPLDFCHCASQFDACVYVVSAQAPLSRSELFVIENLDGGEIPVLVVVSRMDQLMPEQQKDVVEYVSETLAPFPCARVFAPATGFLGSGSDTELRQAIQKLRAETDVKAVRRTYADFFLGAALAAMYEKCNEKLEEVDRKAEAIEKRAIDSRFALDTRLTEWLEIETELRCRMSGISDTVRRVLEERRNDNIRRFGRDIDCWQGDLKVFWDIDFPYRFEEASKLDAEAAAAAANKVFAGIVQWLQDELTRRFRARLVMATGIESMAQEKNFTPRSDVGVSDPSRIRMISRMGTAAAIIGGGLIMFTAGIGGAIAGISILSSIGADLFMNSRTKADKARIKDSLPTLVDRARFESLAAYNDRIASLTDS